jgi:fructose-bisphosphate aldolase, class I
VANEKMLAQMREKQGFIAALDQSGGSTPGALKQYGIPESDYSGDEEMFKLMHEMRVRIVTAPSFTGEKVIGTILFERTMNGEANGKPVPAFLWEDRGIVPFLKVDKGLEDEANGVQLMKPMPQLDTLLKRAVECNIFGTKMRSVIKQASPEGIAAIAKQQFEVAQQIIAHGLVPIIEPEVSIKAPDKKNAEELLLAELKKNLDALPESANVMLKLTIPDVQDLYLPLTRHPRVVRVVALSGGYPLDDACRRLSHNHGMIASFSRALINDLKKQQTDAEFDATLSKTIDQICQASTVKEG